MKTLVIHHSADFDGLFCREIARRALPDAELLGWDYGQPVPAVPPDTRLYILDLSIEGLMDHPNLVWIDHHKSAIEKYPASIPGYRIDCVAACRLAWQWFRWPDVDRCPPPVSMLPTRTDYVERRVSEPLAVRLAGEYDVWDKRDEDAEPFQFGLRSRDLTALDWDCLLHAEGFNRMTEYGTLLDLLDDGRLIQDFMHRQAAETITALGFLVDFAGLKFLALNTAQKGSLQFAAKDVPGTGHDALLKFNWTGILWEVSLYHAAHRTDIDLSQIAVQHGGGGHRGACGFSAAKLPFVLP